MRAWRRSGGLGLAAGLTATVLGVGQEGGNECDVTFSTAVVSVGNIAALEANGNPGVAVLSGLGTDTLRVDFGNAIDPGEPWTYNGPASLTTFANGATAVSSSGVT